MHVRNEQKFNEVSTVPESYTEIWGMLTYARRENIHEDSIMSLKLAKTEARDLFRTRLLRRWSSLWHYLVTTDGWEAVFLLALYFVLRWDERLRGISVVMLASSAISLVVLLSFRQGARHFRFRILYDIARKSYSVGQYDFLFGPNSRLVGMDTSLLCLPFLSFYVLLFPFGIAFSIWFYSAYDETAHPFWQKVGSFGYHLLGKVVLRRLFPEETAGDETARIDVDGKQGNKEQDRGSYDRLGFLFWSKCIVTVLALLFLFPCIVVIAVTAFFFAIPIPFICDSCRNVCE